MYIYKQKKYNKINKNKNQNLSRLLHASDHFTEWPMTFIDTWHIFFLTLAHLPLQFYLLYCLVSIVRLLLLCLFLSFPVRFKSASVHQSPTQSWRIPAQGHATVEPHVWLLKHLEFVPMASWNLPFQNSYPNPSLTYSLRLTYYNSTKINVL